MLAPFAKEALARRVDDLVDSGVVVLEVAVICLVLLVRQSLINCFLCLRAVDFLGTYDFQRTASARERSLRFYWRIFYLGTIFLTLHLQHFTQGDILAIKFPCISLTLKAVEFFFVFQETAALLPKTIFCL